MSHYLSTVGYIQTKVIKLIIFSATDYPLVGNGSDCERLEAGGYRQPGYSTALQYITLIFAAVLLISEVRYNIHTVTLAGVNNVAKNIINPIALRKTKIVCNFGLSECNRVKSTHN